MKNLRLTTIALLLSFTLAEAQQRPFDLQTAEPETFGFDSALLQEHADELEFVWTRARPSSLGSFSLCKSATFVPPVSTEGCQLGLMASEMCRVRWLTPAIGDLLPCQGS